MCTGEQYFPCIFNPFPDRPVMSFAEKITAGSIFPRDRFGTPDEHTFSLPWCGNTTIMLDIRNNRPSGILQHQETYLCKNISGHTVITECQMSLHNK